MPTRSRPTRRTCAHPNRRHSAADPGDENPGDRARLHGQAPRALSQAPRCHRYHRLRSARRPARGGRCKIRHRHVRRLGRGQGVARRLLDRLHAAGHHVGYGLEAVGRGISFFTEANVTDARMAELGARLAESQVVGAPSCTMRYYPGPRRIKALVDTGAIGRALAFTYQSGQYLPDWHPWESYKEFYASKRATGACREIVPFELCWLAELFGPVAALSCMKDRLGDLDADIDDIYQLLLRFESKVIGHLMVDVIARPAVRLFRLLGTAGTIEWDQSVKRLRCFGADDGSWREFSLDGGAVEPGYIHAEEPYVEETQAFLAAVRRERPWPYPFAEDERILRLLERAETSDKSGRHC